MNPFINLSNFRVIVCGGPRCKYAVLTIHVDSHLSSQHHNYNKEQREQVVQEINQIEGLIQDAGGLESFAFPEPTSPAVPELKLAKEGLQCIDCGYICCHEVRMQKHCKELHQWGGQKKGRSSYRKRQSKPKQPWISGVHCQQFFAQGRKKQLFEVTWKEKFQEQEPEPNPDIWTTVQKVTIQRMEHMEKKAKKSI